MVNCERATALAGYCRTVIGSVGWQIDAGVAGAPTIAFVMSNAGLMAYLTLEGTQVTRIESGRSRQRAADDAGSLPARVQALGSELPFPPRPSRYRSAAGRAHVRAQQRGNGPRVRQGSHVSGARYAGTAALRRVGGDQLAHNALGLLRVLAMQYQCRTGQPAVVSQRMV